MSYDEFAFFNQQLAAMLRDGMPLEGALKELCAGMRTGTLRSEIEQLEAEQAKLNRLLADGSLYVSEPKKAADMAARVTQIDDELLTAMERWELLGQRVPV